MRGNCDFIKHTKKAIDDFFKRIHDKMGSAEVPEGQDFDGVGSILENSERKISDDSGVRLYSVDISRGTRGEDSTSNEEVYGGSVSIENTKAGQQENKTRDSMVMEFHLQPDVKLEDLQVTKNALMFALSMFRVFADANGLPVNISSLVSDRENVQAVSRTHEEGRAVDLRVAGWPEHKIREVVEWMLYKDQEWEIGAISASDNLRRIIVYHEYKGQGKHFHIQVSRDADKRLWELMK